MNLDCEKIRIELLELLSGFSIALCTIALCTDDGHSIAFEIFKAQGLLTL